MESDLWEYVIQIPSLFITTDIYIFIPNNRTYGSKL